MLHFISQNIYIISKLKIKPFKLTPKMKKPVGSTIGIFLYSVYLYFYRKWTQPAYSFYINVNFWIVFKTWFNFISQNIFIFSKLNSKPFKTTRKMNKPVESTFSIFFYSIYFILLQKVDPTCLFIIDKWKYYNIF